MLDRLDAERRGNVGLVSSGAADQHDVIGTVDELAAMDLANHRLVDLAVGEVEPGQILVARS
jgi:hypothetical protein